MDVPSFRLLRPETLLILAPTLSPPPQALHQQIVLTLPSKLFPESPQCPNLGPLSPPIWTSIAVPPVSLPPPHLLPSFFSRGSHSPITSTTHTGSWWPCCLQGDIRYCSTSAPPLLLRTSLDHGPLPGPSNPLCTMALPGHILLLLLLPVAAAQMSPGPCSGCGPLSLQLLAGLVAADAVMSLLIVGVVFVCARPRRKPTQEGKIYINMPGRG
ncbi:hematopoietic cell signal transducer isoform X2 [Choloepus didactylus]|uniref:hematopoietic cell signal transducer isoform X2 n=1 Tax=Choloepus didactylus TaxID=27675 RepID=UPI00189D92EB|nr:hematopoietic cell signal transducer isoform X2 [Choloepus didactylus]